METLSRKLNYTLEHCKGSTNIGADALSRLCAIKDKATRFALELKELNEQQQLCPRVKESTERGKSKEMTLKSYL